MHANIFSVPFGSCGIHFNLYLFPPFFYHICITEIGQAVLCGRSCAPSVSCSIWLISESDEAISAEDIRSVLNIPLRTGETHGEVVTPADDFRSGLCKDRDRLDRHCKKEQSFWIIAMFEVYDDAWKVLVHGVALYIHAGVVGQVLYKYKMPLTYT